MVEENSRLSRAMAAVILAGALSCTLNRTGFNGSLDQPGPIIDGGASEMRPGSDGTIDGPVDSQAEEGGRTGQGGTGGGGAGGDGGGSGGASGDSGDGGVDRGGGADVPVDQGSPDLGVDAIVCGASPLCASSAVTVTLPGGRFTGATAGASFDHGSCGGDGAPEAVFSLVLTQKSDVFITTHGTHFNTVVYMRSDCCGAEISCNDDADKRATSVLRASGLAAGQYSIFVDGADANQKGAFTVDIYATPTSDTAGDNCGGAARIADLPVTGTTCTLADDFSPLGTGCLAPPSATTAADAVYYFVLDDPSTVVTFSTCTNTCIDTILFLRDVCTMAASQMACNDDFCRPVTCPVGPPKQSRTTATLGPGVHYLVLDSHVVGPATPCGPFTISSTGVPQ